METPRHLKCLVFASFLFRKDLIDLETITELFQSVYGDFLLFHPPFSSMLNYYQKEMGEVDKLDRVILCSKNSYSKDCLLQIKKWALKLESKYQNNQSRYLNIDPGIVSLDQMILTSVKPYAHRIYLGESIFSELCYIYKDGHFHILDWTYPDYRAEDSRNFFKTARSLLL